jgi:hypothetical protein
MRTRLLALVSRPGTRSAKQHGGARCPPSPAPWPLQVPFSEFIRRVKHDDVRTVSIDGLQISFSLKPNSLQLPASLPAAAKDGCVEAPAAGAGHAPPPLLPAAAPRCGPPTAPARPSLVPAALHEPP